MGFAGASGNFQLNVYNPVMIYNLLQSISYSVMASAFHDKCVVGIETNASVIQETFIFH